MLAKFEHSPIVAGQIRLCRLVNSPTPTDHDKAVSLELRTFAFDDTLEPYVALSYTWGDASHSHKISINSGSFQVRDNLYHFLAQIKQEQDFDTWFWIDQLCIAQVNHSERSHQVQMMADIYSRADKVCIWLGRTTSKSSATMATLMDYFQMSRHVNHYFTADPFPFEALTSLGEQPFWGRRWILQEIFVAAHIELRWGSAKIHDFDHFAEHLREMPEYRYRDGYHFLYGCSVVIDRWESLRLPRYKLLPLSFAVRSFHDCQCSEPRDAVYAIMGLCQPDQRLVVDYTKDCMEIFRECAEIIWEDSHGEWILAKLSMIMGLDIWDTSSSSFKVRLEVRLKQTSGIESNGNRLVPAIQQENPEWREFSGSGSVLQWLSSI